MKGRMSGNNDLSQSIMPFESPAFLPPEFSPTVQLSAILLLELTTPRAEDSGEGRKEGRKAKNEEREGKVHVMGGARNGFFLEKPIRFSILYLRGGCFRHQLSHLQCTPLKLSNLYATSRKQDFSK